MYASVDVGEKIPQELYQAVAEVLAFVYGVKNREIPTKNKIEKTKGDRKNEED